MVIISLIYLYKVLNKISESPYGTTYKYSIIENASKFYIHNKLYFDEFVVMCFKV